MTAEMLGVFRRGRLRNVKSNPCRACLGDGFSPGAMHQGRGIWFGRVCEGCEGSGRGPDEVEAQPESVS